MDRWPLLSISLNMSLKVRGMGIKPDVSSQQNGMDFDPELLFCFDLPVSLWDLKVLFSQLELW